MTFKSTRLNTVGQTYHDFQVTKVKEISELQCHLLELVHLPTGAQVIHIANDDPENLFCLSFRTLPENSNGVAHVLEHTVLCGSEKFPIKDPFFAMGRRSLNTFMNALTGADFTCYPAASQVPKDFYNLLEVYLDAVFHPNLKELSFLQEGHRLEFAVPNDPQSPLEHKGIVFNEMKGALSSANARLSEAMNAALFPDLTYGFNSGGDPTEIPNLTYRELWAFYEQYYHPSHCLFFFYGNMPLEGHLDFIAKHSFKGVKKAAPIPPLPLQPRFTQPKSLTVPYPVLPEEDSDDKALISFGWLTCHILQQQEVLALSVLEIILMDTDASPLKLALLKSGLCKQASISMDADISEVPIVITLRGCNSEDADRLEKVIRKTLEEVILNGISLEFVENAIHQLEFARTEITGNHSPYGLSLFMRSALLKQHEGDPENGLMIHSLFVQLRHKLLEDPHYLTNMINKYFLDNTHFVRIVMQPDKQLATKEMSEEREALNKLRSQLAAGQVKQIVEKAADLVTFQKKQEEEDLEVLPKIHLDDVPKFSRNFLLKQESAGALQVYHHGCFTNDIVYASLIFDLPDIQQEELPLIQLFAVFLAQVGAGGRSYGENLEYIQAHTGGIGAFLSLQLQVEDNHQFKPSFCIHGKSLHRKANKLFPLFHDIVTSLDFTNIERIKEILLKHYISLHSGLNQNALRYAINLSASALDITSKIGSAWHGLEYYWTIKSLAEDIEAQAKPLAEKLQMLRQRLLGLNHPDLVLTCNNATYDELKRHRFYGLQDMETHSFTPWKGQYTLKTIPNQGRIIASPVAFTGRVLKTVPYVHPDAPALIVAASLFENVVLHKLIREQGGAYGGGASFNPLSGNFCFYAYRDPNINNTLHAFEEATRTIASGQFDASDLEEAKLEVIQTLDSPVAPGSRGDLAYGWFKEGKTHEIRQAFRNRLLALTSQDVIIAVEKHILNSSQIGPTVVFAGKELLDKENALLASQNKSPFMTAPI